MSETEAPFWVSLPLEELSEAQWEALCDGCGRCCLIRLEDEDTGELLDTRLACRLLDIGACRCSDYENRREKVPECVVLSPQICRTLDWLPDTCAYRLRAQGKPLFWWHPLRSGRPESVHEAGISVRGWAVSETKERLAAYSRFAMRGARRQYRAARRRRSHA